MPTVSIVYPADPVGIVPGGIDTFIRGIAAHAPADIDICLLGFTMDSVARPVGRWTQCPVGHGVLRMFPVLEVGEAGVRSRVPLTLRFSAAVARHRKAVSGDILEFHRLEPALLFLADRRPKNAFVHQNMKALRNRQSDILWSRFPWLYYSLEDRLLPQFASVFVVVEEAAAWYRERYPQLADRFRFTPTWVDPADFRAPQPDERALARRWMHESLGIDAGAEILLSVGRLDHQKDPLLLARSFERLAQSHPGAHLVYVGDGVLRPDLLRFVAEAGLADRIHLAGLRDRREIARMLWATDLFVLASAYEGMPMSVLEALGSGVPVVTTDVGEVRRVVRPGRSGVVVAQRTPEALAAAMAATLEGRAHLAGAGCLAAVEPYSPARVLEPVYENYRRIAAAGRRVA